MLELIRCDPNTAAADIISNTSAETLFSNYYISEANSYVTDNSARFFDIEAYGVLSTLVTTPGTLTMKLKWGSTIIGATAAVQLPAAALSQTGWHFQGKIRIGLTGTSGLVVGFGAFTIDNANVDIISIMTNPGTGQTGYKTVNTQTLANVGLSATFSIASTSNIIQCNDLEIVEKR